MSGRGFGIWNDRAKTVSSSNKWRWSEFLLLRNFLKIGHWTWTLLKLLSRVNNPMLAQPRLCFLLSSGKGVDVNNNTEIKYLEASNKICYMKGRLHFPYLNMLIRRSCRDCCLISASVIHLAKVRFQPLATQNQWAFIHQHFT